MFGERNRTTRLNRSLATAVLVAILAACGGANPASPSGNTTGNDSQGTAAATSGAAVGSGDVVPDPCVLEPDDLNAALDSDDFTAGVVQQSSGSNAVCDYETASALVSLTIEDYDTSLFEDFKDDPGSKLVSDLGDDAFVGPLNILFVRKGGLDFTLQILHVSMDAEAIGAAGIELARLVLDRI